METLNSVRRTLNLAGYRPDGSVAFQARLFTTFLILYAMDLVYSMLLSRGDMKNILAIKELTSILMALVLVPGSSKVFTLCDVIVTQLRQRILEPIVPELAQIRSQLDLEHNKTGRKIYKTLSLIIIVYVSVPVLQSVFVIALHEIPLLASLERKIGSYKDNQTVNRANKTLNVEEDLSMVFYFYYPNGLATIWFYFILSMLHAYWCIWICLFLYCIFNSALMSIKNTISDMRVLGLALERLPIGENALCGKGSLPYKFMALGGVGRTNMEMSEQTVNEKMLKYYFRLIVLQHQQICRDLSIIDDGMKTVIVALDVAFAVHMCLAIYCIVKMETFSLKFEYTILLFWLMTVTYNYSALGQQITNEGDDLMMKLYDCPWLGKPQWLKASLLLTMTRATIRMELKPYDIYALNLTSFTNVMNAVYSLFNLLKKIA